LRREYPDMEYVTFDDPALARFADTEPDAFLGQVSDPLILDEVQYVPGLFRHLKVRIDEDSLPGRFLMTGSQTFSLMQNVSESLAWRCGILEMTSLGYLDALTARPELGELEFLVRGGFPELYAGRLDRPSDWYAAFHRTRKGCRSRSSPGSVANGKCTMSSASPGSDGVQTKS
jgi:uncharacterized protein